MDLRGYEFYKTSGTPVSGALAEIWDAVDGTPGGSPITSTTTTSNGQWEFLGVTDTPKDVKVSFTGSIRWYKGLTKSDLTKLFVGTGGITSLGNVGIGAAPVAAQTLGVTAGGTASQGIVLGGTVITATGSGYGANLSPTFVAQANSDTLYGLIINPVFNDNSKTGVVHYGVYSVSGLNFFGDNVGIGVVPASSVGIYMLKTINAASAVGYGLALYPTLVAQANGDTLYGFSVGGGFSDNGKTGVTHYGGRISPTWVNGNGDNIGLQIDVSTGGNAGNAFGLIVGPPSGATGSNASIVGYGDVLAGGVANGSDATTATTGFLWIPYMDGTPTGTPANNGKSPFNGHVPMVYDRVNFKLYIYFSGTWKSVTLA